MSRARDIKVGLFVLVGLVMTGLAIFLIGEERRLFDPSVEFKARFGDVQGLKAGAPIRMGGIDIGHVAEVRYGDDPKDLTVYVMLDVVRSEAKRIKKDSIVRVAAKGLLGDKMIEITKGGPTSEPIPFGGEIPSEEPKDMLGKVEGIAEKADDTLLSIKRVSESLANEKLHRDLQGTVSSLNVVLHEVAHGEGYPHRFLTDKAEAERISKTLANLDRATSELTSLLSEARSVVARGKNGPGFTHDVIYGDGPTKAVDRVGSAAGELAVTLRGVREGDGFAKELLYGGGSGETARATANIAAVTADLRTIVAGVKAGKGTVGALLVDPSIYEDMKTVLGNVRRNEVLRALVRYSIKQDEKAPPAGVAPRD